MGRMDHADRISLRTVTQARRSAGLGGAGLRPPADCERRNPRRLLRCVRLGGISRISALRVASALSAAVVLVFILETASVLTLAISAVTGTYRWGRALLAPYLGMLLAVVAGFGRLAQRPATARRNGTI